MNGLLTKHRRRLDRYLLILVAVLFITWIIPKQVQFKYDFELGKPWRYDDLLAPFDFSLSKSEQELFAERNRVMDGFIPYYERLPEVQTIAIDRFSRDLKLQFILLLGDTAAQVSSADSTKLMKAGVDILTNLFQNGIIELDSSHLNYENNRRIYVMNADEASLSQVGDLYNNYRAMQAVSPESFGLNQRSANFVRQLINNSIRPNIRYRQSISQKALDEELNRISTRKGKVNKGEKIIFKGELVNEASYELLFSLKQEFQKYRSGSKAVQIWLGYFIVALLVLGIFTVFLLQFKQEIFRNIRYLLFILILISAFVALTIFSESQEYPTLLIVPFCIVPIIIRTFFGSRTALTTHISVLLLCSFIVANGSDFLYLHLIAGMVAIYGSMRAQYWSQFFVVMAWLFISYSLSWLGLSLIREGSFENIQAGEFGWIGLNVFFCFMAYPLILVFERLFGTVSDITLRELADLDRPILKELSLKAPGTMQHSVQVANLAEAAIREIGGNTLLTRVGCLYHDIGKIPNSEYYIENQTGRNPHDSMAPEESAELIIRHIEDGLALAKKHGVPKEIQYFIRTHHGDTRVEYFWRKWQQNQTEATQPTTSSDQPTESSVELESEVESDPQSDSQPDSKSLEISKAVDLKDDSAFRYPGPKPSTKEAAVAMMADSVEAASRSLRQPTAQQITDLVEKIIDGKMKDNQFIQADLTFKDITKIKQIFARMLQSVYHIRIDYAQQ
ncbi:MAG: putative nucleotidyltransferase with HDIG domain [Limisphaerales bacterium]|jgi:putative nucleotidyltransferase with HDIG domain